MFKIVIICLFLCGCATWERMEKKAWEKDGACATICDYNMNSMCTSYTLDPQHCSCYSPAAAEFNAGRLLPLDNEHGVFTCIPDCKTIADKIISRQPWRAPKFRP